MLVRYSGTEKKCRVMIEGDSIDRIEAYAADISEAITQAIGA